MNKFTLDDRTLLLLKAQANLSETFNHTLRSPQSEALSFTLKVDRNKTDTLFTIEVENEKHTLTLKNAPKAHLKLADFIEEIVNGSNDASTATHLQHASREYPAFHVKHRQKVFDLVRTGGGLVLDMGLKLPILLAIHRTQARQGITTIMSIGVKRPRTKCFTASGSDVEMYEMVAESINHLAAAATPAAHAA
ncbi:hypothetical protein QCD79_01705 [Pseudomonas quasicaspiana]|nr:hypothetical protein [Pseudomonas quasicaspiana]